MEIHKIISQSVNRKGQPIMQVATIVDAAMPRNLIKQVSMTRHLVYDGKAWLGNPPTFAIAPALIDYTEAVKAAQKRAKEAHDTRWKHTHTSPQKRARGVHDTGNGSE